MCCQAEVAWACYLPPHCALSLSGSSQWEVLPDMHAAVSPKVWQSEAVSQLCSLQQVLWKGEVKGHGHQSTLLCDLTFQDPQQNFSEVIGILPSALHSHCQPCSWLFILFPNSQFPQSEGSYISLGSLLFIFISYPVNHSFFKILISQTSQC